MAAQLRLDLLGICRPRRHQADNKPAMPRPQPPQMKVIHPRAQLALHRGADSGGKLGIGIGIQQHQRAVTDQAISPGCDHHRTEHAHRRVQPRRAPVITRRQRHDGQQRCAGIGQHMHIGGAHIVVVMVMTVMIVFQDQGADQVDGQANHRDQKRIAILNCRWRDQTHHGFACHRQRRQAQDDGAGESGQIAELSRTERKARVGGMAARQPVCARGQAQRAHMGRHVHAIGQQRHGAVEKSRPHLHHHEDGGDGCRDQGAAFRMGMGMAQEMMAAGPHAMVMRAGDFVVMDMIMGHGVILRTP